MVAVRRQCAVREEDVLSADREGNCDETEPKSTNYKGDDVQGIVWRNVILMILLHSASIYSLFLIPVARPLTLAWCKSERQKTHLL